MLCPFQQPDLKSTYISSGGPCSPSGLQAISTMRIFGCSPTPTSHILKPWFEFQRLMRSVPPSLDKQTTRSLSGQHEEATKRLDEGRCTFESDTNALESIDYFSKFQCSRRSQFLSLYLYVTVLLDYLVWYKSCDLLFSLALA